MASPGFNNFDVELTEEDIPGAFLAGRILSKLKMDELRFWLKCRVVIRAKALKRRHNL
jgi:hypothetical protein